MYQHEGKEHAKLGPGIPHYEKREPGSTLPERHLTVVGPQLLYILPNGTHKWLGSGLCTVGTMYGRDYVRSGLCTVGTLYGRDYVRSGLGVGPRQAPRGDTCGTASYLAASREPVSFCTPNRASIGWYQVLPAAIGCCSSRYGYRLS